ncbi:MAG TPA: hypothetical protein VJ179_03670, partial [Patescibacteria group bacterium]|nr:hypothetical protein [Patescibacteria group bacterium]
TFVGVSGKIPLLFSLTAPQFLMIGVTVLFVTGYVLTWYKALSYAPATLVTTVLVFGSVVTNVLTVISQGIHMSLPVFSQTVFTLAGIWFFFHSFPRLNKKREKLTYQ